MTQKSTIIKRAAGVTKDVSSKQSESEIKKEGMLVTMLSGSRPAFPFGVGGGPAFASAAALSLYVKGICIRRARNKKWIIFPSAHIT